MEKSDRHERLNSVPAIEQGTAMAPDVPTLPGDSPTSAWTGGWDAEGDDSTEGAFRALEEQRRTKRKRRLHRRIAIVGGIVGALVVTFVVVGLLTPAQVEELPTVEVTRGDFETTVSSSGALEPISSTIVSPEVDGIIEDVNVSLGSAVSEGDVLFTIKNDSLDQAVAQAQLEVRSAKLSLEQANASVSQATEAAAGTPEEGKVDNTSIDSAKIGLEKAQESLDEAQARADKRSVVAGASGSIIAMSAVSGATVGQGSGSGSSGSTEPLMQIGDLSQMKVKVQVNEIDITKVAVGQAAKVSFSSLPDVTLDGTVTAIATTSTSSTSSMSSGSGVVTYTVELVIPSPDPRLKPGMTASAKITTESLTDVLTVPANAIQTDQDGSTYLIVQTTDEKGTSSTESRTITVTTSNSTYSVVSGNISEGDLVVIPTTGDVDGATGTSGSTVAVG